MLLKSRLNEVLSLRLRASWHAKIREAPTKESLAALWLGNFGVTITTTHMRNSRELPALLS